MGHEGTIERPGGTCSTCPWREDRRPRGPTCTHVDGSVREPHALRRPASRERRGVFWGGSYAGSTQERQPFDSPHAHGEECRDRFWAGDGVKRDRRSGTRTLFRPLTAAGTQTKGSGRMVLSSVQRPVSSMPPERGGILWGTGGTLGTKP